MSYINVRHANFLSSKFTAGEARELGRRYTCLDKLTSLWDESAERMSWRFQELAHTAVEEEAPVQEEFAQPEEPGEPEALAQSTE